MAKPRNGLVATAMHGCVVEAQPVGKDRGYSYRLQCGCGWQSAPRKGHIDVIPGATQGRFDCEACNRSVVFTIREDRESAGTNG
uniref:Uncharacterized protein n=1 Tax=viral metagenome TaxID=1070528 RepID=A0A6H1ZIQ1_9ZZZZ